MSDNCDFVVERDVVVFYEPGHLSEPFVLTIRKPPLFPPLLRLDTTLANTNYKVCTISTILWKNMWSVTKYTREAPEDRFGRILLHFALMCLKLEVACLGTRSPLKSARFRNYAAPLLLA